MQRALQPLQLVRPMWGVSCRRCCRASAAAAWLGKGQPCSLSSSCKGAVKLGQGPVPTVVLLGQGWELAGGLEGVLSNYEWGRAASA